MNPLASIMLRSTLLFACVFSMTLHSTKNISKQIEDADSLLKNSKRSTRLSEKVIFNLSKKTNYKKLSQLLSNETYEVLSNLQELAKIKEDIQQYVHHNEGHVSTEGLAMSAVIEKTLNSTCAWLADELSVKEEYFDCSLNALTELKLYLDSLSVLKKLYLSLNLVKTLSGIHECQYMKEFIACDDTISSDVKQMISRMAKACTSKHMTCDTDNR